MNEEMAMQYQRGYIDGFKDVKTTFEPKTVLYSGNGYADGYMAKCPNCGYEYEDGDKDWGLSFCPNCGQALNWKGANENV